MTCRGYDPKAIKLPKSIKRVAANHANDHERGAFIKSWVRVFEEQMRSRGRREKDN